MSEINFMTKLVEKSNFNRKRIYREIYEKEQEKYERYVHLMCDLTNKYYQIVTNTMNNFANLGRYYCVLEFKNSDFRANHPGLGTPVQVAYRWLECLTTKINFSLVDKNGALPYLGNPLSYRIIRHDYNFKMYSEEYPIYTCKSESESYRDTILIEFRWGNIPLNKRKYFKNVPNDTIYNNEERGIATISNQLKTR